MYKFALFFGLISLSVSSFAFVDSDGHAYLPIQAHTSETTPKPNAFNTENNPKKITLQQAIIMAIKQNATLQIAIKNRKKSFYDLVDAKGTFHPKLSLSSNVQRTHSGDGSITNSYSVGPHLSWKAPTGTQIDANYYYNPSKTYHSTDPAETENTQYDLSITQPLMQGRSIKANMADLDNAYDEQHIQDFQLQQSIQKTIETIANDYYAAQAAMIQLSHAKTAQQQAEKQLQAATEKLKDGRIPGIDLTQSHLTALDAKNATLKAQDALMQSKTQLANDLGIDVHQMPDIEENFAVKPHKVTADQALADAKAHNLDLKIQQFQYQQKQRSLIASSDKRKMTMDLKLDFDHYSTANQIASSVTKNDNRTASLNFNVPLDYNSDEKQRLQDAIDLQTQQIDNANTLQSLQNNVKSAVDSLNSTYSQVQQAQTALQLAQKNAKAAHIKYQYGRISAFELSQQLQQYQSSLDALTNAKLDYQKQWIAYQIQTGTLLENWHIHIKENHYV